MQLDRLTRRLQEALVSAQQTARRNGNPEIQPEHLAQALLAQEGGLMPTLLTRLGVDVESTRRRVDDAVAGLAKTTGGAEARAGRELTALFDRAESIRDTLQDEYTSVEHLVLAWAETRSGTVGGILEAAGVSWDDVLSVLQAIRGSQRVTDQARSGPSWWGPSVTVRWWLGELMLEAGRPGDAERYFQSIPADPLAALRLEDVYANLGEFEKARESYEYALLSWQDAGPELGPHIEVARQGLARLPKPLRRERS